MQGILINYDKKNPKWFVKEKKYKLVAFPREPAVSRNITTTNPYRLWLSTFTEIVGCAYRTDLILA